MKYEELKKFIREEMIMEKGRNYQPVMIKTLNQNDGKASREQIKQALHEANPEHPANYFNDSPVFDVLTKSHPVARFNEDTKMYELLDYETYTTPEKAWITMYCDKKIDDESIAQSTGKRVILFSVAGQKSYEHFRDTITTNVITDSIHGPTTLKSYPDIRVWGSINNKQNFNKWQNLKKGDILLFYHNKKYVASAILEGKEQNPDVARQLWGYKDSENKQTFELMLYMLPSNVNSEVVDYEKVNELLGYMEIFMPTRTLDFTTIAKSRTDDLAQKFGSIENALGSIGFSLSRKLKSEIPEYIESLISKFDANRNLFRPERISEEEREKIRRRFVEDFSVDKIQTMKIHEYVMWRKDSDGNYLPTFCYRMQKPVPGYGGIRTGPPYKYGVYWKNAINNYEYRRERFSSATEAFEATKNEIIDILKTGQRYAENHDIQSFSKSFDKGDFVLSSLFRARILVLYFPDHFIGIHSIEKINDILDLFGRKRSSSDKYSEKQQELFELKISHPIMKKWSNEDFREFVWKIKYHKGDEEEEDIIEEVVETTNYLLLRHNAKGSEWKDDLGKKYHFGVLPNYKKIVPGTKTIWYDREEGNFLYWGYGTISNTEKKSDDDYFAYFDDFKFFNEPVGSTFTPKRGEKITQEKIMSLPGWNNQISMLPITKEIYDNIINTKSKLNTFDDASLEIPTTEELKSGIAKIHEELLIDPATIQEIVVNLVSGRHVLLAGPVGTGKTQLARLIPKYFWPKSGGYFSEVFTATAEWSTQDVIGGIMPKMVNDDVKYEIQYGCVTQTILENWLDKTCQSRIKNQHENETFNGTWLVIDEFNRADIDKAFGPLFTSLETKYLKVPSDKEYESYIEIKLPEDYRIIGTLNTADKHYLFRLSDALKRRFAYIEVSLPSKDQKDKEIYYALNNAIKELPQATKFKWLSLNNSEMIIDEENSDQSFVSKIKIAYDVLDFIRASKPLGTAILKSIYQTLLIGSRVTQNFDNSLDLSLNTNLIPQLENVSTTTLETILSFFSDDVVEFFKKIHDESPIRERYSNDFVMLLYYCNIKSPDKKITAFSNGELNDENIWESIRNKVEEVKISAKIPIFTKSISELIKASSMI